MYFEWKNASGMRAMITRYPMKSLMKPIEKRKFSGMTPEMSRRIDLRCQNR